MERKDEVTTEFQQEALDLWKSHKNTFPSLFFHELPDVIFLIF